MVFLVTNTTFEEFVSEDNGFCLDSNIFDGSQAFDEVRYWIEEHGHKVVQQRPCSEFSDYISGWTNYTKWEFTYLPDEDVWEFEWNITEQ